MASARTPGRIDEGSSRRRTPAPQADRTTLLVLSGFLVGIGLQGVAGTQLGPYTVAAGSAGLLGYLALSHLARRQEQARSTLETERKLLRLHARLDRHLPQMRPNRRTQRDRRLREDMLLQYMPVVHAGSRRHDARPGRGT